MKSPFTRDVRGVSLLLLLLTFVFAHGASALVLSGVPADASAYCGQIPPPPPVTAASSCVHQPTNGLILYFSFDASNSTAIVDDSGHGREGVVNGATWTPAGHRGGAYSFDGVNDEIRVPNHPSLNPTNGITLSAWVSIAGTGTYNGIVMLKGSQPGGNAGQYGLLYRAQVSQGFNGRMSFSIATSQTGWQDYLSSSNISLSTWHHLAGCYASGDLRFYIDGQPARGAMSNIVGRLLALTGDLFIGSEHSFPSAEYFRGRIDEVRVYDRALSAPEVALLASGLSAPVPVQMVETGGGACPGTLSRTWTATDACGNSTSATQVITLQPAPPPTLVGVPPDLVLNHGDPVPPPPLVTATSLCVPAAPADGLVLHYALDNNTGSNVFDQSTYGHDGTAVGAAFTTNGHQGGAYQFDGAGDRIQVGRPPALVAGIASQFTMSAWFNPASVQGRYVAGRGRSYYNDAVMFCDGSGKVVWILKVAGQERIIFSPQPYGLNVWSHMAVSFDGTAARCFINGAQVAVSNITGTIEDNGNNFIIGDRHTLDRCFIGRIDEVRVYNRALASNEVALLGAGNAPPSVQFLETRGGTSPEIITRVWTATDACGGSVSATQTITILPPIPPVLVGVPSDLVLNFGDPVPPAPVVTATSQCERAAEPSAGLLLYYPFTEADTAVAQDYSGHGHTGTVVGAVFATNGFQGGSFAFDGSGDRIIVGRPPALVSALSDHFTMSAWVYPYAQQDRYVVGRGRNANNDAVMYVHDSGKVIWIVKVAGQERIIFSPQAYPVNAWSHMAMTFDGSVLKCFIGGVLAVSSNIAGAIEDSGNDFIIGDRHTLDRPYLGRIDEVRVYDRALSDGEVAALGALPAQPVVTFATTTRGACPQTITRVWSAVDACGSSAAATQTITIVDHNAPALAGVPSNLTLACDQEIPLVPVVTAIDDRGYVALQFAEAYSGACPGVLTRTWTAFDECGNRTSAVQHIHLVAVDRDGDGVPDQFETGTGVYVSPTNTGTDPAKSDTDGDGYADGVEIVRGSDPNDPNSRPRGTDLDFDADLVSDVGVYNPQDGSWLVRQSGRGLASWSLGGKQFSPVPADYDGDGRTDPAVVAATSGKWLILAANGTTNTIKFNAASAVPAIGDFDGDGRTDLCLYDARKGLWLFYHTNASVRTIQFGTAGTVPVVGDYDGDGRDDIAVYQPAMGQWYMFRSREGFKTVQFGYAGAVPVAADYDGDGRDDVAVYESSTGRWYLSRSRAGFTVVQFGFPGATPVVADFDGDGRADPAVYSSGGNAWYILCSRDGFKTINLGNAGSMPLGAR